MSKVIGRLGSLLSASASAGDVEIAAERGLRFRLAAIPSGIPKDWLARKVREGRVSPVGAVEAQYTGTAPLSEEPKTGTYTHAYAQSNGFLTLLSDGKRLTGAYALGPQAGEWLQQATLAIASRMMSVTAAGAVTIGV